MSRGGVFGGSVLLFGVAGRCRGAHGCAAPEALDVHLKDGGVVDEPVDGGDGHGLVREHGVPSAEGLVCGDHDGAPFVSCCDELEEDAGFGLILPDIGEVVEDQQVEAIELCDFVGEVQRLSCGLQALDEIGRPGEEDTVSTADELVAEASRSVGFPCVSRSP